MFNSICHALGICPCCHSNLVAILSVLPAMAVWAGSYLCFWKLFKKPIDKDDK
jgi:hypothetical protein